MGLTTHTSYSPNIDISVFLCKGNLFRKNLPYISLWKFRSMNINNQHIHITQLRALPYQWDTKGHREMEHWPLACLVQGTAPNLSLYKKVMPQWVLWVLGAFCCSVKAPMLRFRVYTTIGTTEHQRHRDLPLVKPSLGNVVCMYSGESWNLKL